MFIGFRNPVPQGKALVVPLLNPREVVHGQRAQPGESVLLDLAGRGTASVARTWKTRPPSACGLRLQLPPPQACIPKRG